MNLTIGDIKNIIAVINFAATFIIAVYTWQLRKHKANSEHTKQVEQLLRDEVSAIKRDLTKIETSILHMPNSESIGKVHARLDEQTKTMHEVVGTLTNLTNQVAMLNQHLLERDK